MSILLGALIFFPDIFVGGGFFIFACQLLARLRRKMPQIFPLCLFAASRVEGFPPLRNIPHPRPTHRLSPPLSCLSNFDGQSGFLNFRGGKNFPLIFATTWIFLLLLLFHPPRLNRGRINIENIHKDASAMISLSAPMPPLS